MHREPDVGLDPASLGLRPGPKKGRRQTTAPPRDPPKEKILTHEWGGLIGTTLINVASPKGTL